MSAAATLSGASLTSAHRDFESALPAIDLTLRFLFRRWPRRRRAEAINDARAATWHAWAGLLRRGLDPLAVGVTGIAANAARYVKNGRKLGCGTAGRGALDVYHPRAQRSGGFTLVSLDSGDDAGEPSGRGEWRDWLAEDRTCSPADLAASRIDLEAWLSRLPERKRRIFELLAEGHEGLAVARALGCSPARVCQVRQELEASWREYQGPAAGGPASEGRRDRLIGVAIVPPSTRRRT